MGGPGRFLSTSISRRPLAPYSCNNALTNDDLPVPRSGQQDIVGRAASQELFGVADQLGGLAVYCCQAG